ncbi:hypothetical protein PMZ80_002865 [Knufia obscura]|uniref:F-box domain-containing protein n=2 Tax=Knufia TaxID=430999 RepID=A0AAN8ESD4_9EURO|nr:hypothetical protein PMZ80_002865 [Knufia obscura]KAK5952546.1 hypothetical protein OHC33_006591 [Knufia fluminis]
MHKVPNELLTKILALVPYSPKALQTLKQVNKRFREITDSNALRLAIAHNQCFEMIALCGTPVLHSDHLARYMARYAKVEAAVKKIAKKEDTPKVTQALTLGMYLLEFMDTLEYDVPGVETWVYLWVAAREYFLPGPVKLAVRYTVSRICDTYFPSYGFYACLLRFEDIRKLRAAENGLRENIVWLETFRKRAFEAAALRKHHNVRIVDAINENEMDQFYMDAASHFQLLLCSLQYQTKSDIHKPRYAEGIGYLRAWQWRMLSHREGPSLRLARDPEINPAFFVPVFSETLVDNLVKDYVEDKGGYCGAHFDVDLKRAGIGLRTVVAHVKAKDIPEDLMKLVEEEQLTKFFA